MKFIYLLLAIGLFLSVWQKAALATTDINLDSLRPAEEIARELGQPESLSENELSKTNDPTKDGDYHPHPLFPHRLYPHHYHPPYPYYRPYYYPVTPYPTGYRGVICYATNDMGNVFSAWGYYVVQAQQEALNQCVLYSNRVCYSQGCFYQ